MAYIGRGIDNISQIEVLDLITFTDSAGPYNILKGAVAFIPSTVNSLLIEVDGIIQAPASYTVDGSTITFGVSMPSTSTMNSMIHFGTGLITTPADGSVTAAKIASDAVTTAKILDNNVTVAKLPTTLNISGNTVTLPASVSGLGTGITNAQLAGSIDVTSKITGVVPTANLGSGSASASTYLAGDQSYKTIVATDIAWQSVVTGATLTAVAGRGYPIDTTSNACTVTLPASASVGDQIIFTDYARNFSTNALTINQNSLNYQGYSSPNPEYDTAGESIHIVYQDATKGWIPINDGAVAMETPQTYQIEFLVVAGGGSGGSGTSGAGYASAGGGAGGYRPSTQTGFSTGGGTITATVGTGGVVSTGDGGNDGNASSISGGEATTISSAGGGAGGSSSASAPGIRDGNDGGSGGGAGSNTGATGGAATPITDPVQGYAGGSTTGDGGDGNTAAPGGGGASETGDTQTTSVGGDGGDGLANDIIETGTDVTYAGGGGGGAGYSGGTGTGGAAGAGGGGAGSGTGGGTVGTQYLGGGGGGCKGGYQGGAGGDGVVIMRMLTADFGSVTGSPTESTDGLYKVLKFTGDGTYVQ